MRNGFISMHGILSRSLSLNSIFFAHSCSQPIFPRSPGIMMASSSSSSSSGQSLTSVLHSLESNNQVFLLDGGTGEELFRRGVPDDRKIWSATAVVRSEYHGILEQVHTSFLQAGSRAITTNSYGIVPGVGFEEAERETYISQSGEIARRAVHQEQHDQQQQHSTFVLGSLGPLVESYRADLIRSHGQGVREYQVACRALYPHVDAYLAETMSCLEESLQALEAASMYTDRPCIVSYTLTSHGNLRDDQSVISCLNGLLHFCQQNSVPLVAVLFNCCEPEAITMALGRIKDNQALSSRLQSSNILLGAYANRLTAVDPNWSMAESEAAQPFRKDLCQEHYWNDFVKLWTTKFGVRLVGGCCGITPEHIAYLRARLV